jgi:hypothetical protein
MLLSTLQVSLNIKHAGNFFLIESYENVKKKYVYRLDIPKAWKD